MEALYPHLPVIWLCIIGFFLLYYAVTDGFDLGVGIISLFAKEDEERGLLMSSIIGTWHDHQTWLVLLGGMLFGAFPVFYGLVLSALYVPLVVMLLGLIVRGVSFEFREQSPRRKHVWGIAFGLGSLLVTLGQGFALGGLLSGALRMDGLKFSGGALDWASPFSLLVAFGVLCGYVMLGANFLIYKTVDPIRKRSVRISAIFSVLTLGVAVLVHGLTVGLYPAVAARLATASVALPITLCVAVAAFAFVMLFSSLRSLRRELAPFVWNVVVILSSFLGLSLEMYPNMIPNVTMDPVTVHKAAASPPVLLFMLAVSVLIVPVILVYTGYKYRVFRGKTHGEGYETERV